MALALFLCLLLVSSVQGQGSYLVHNRPGCQDYLALSKLEMNWTYSQPDRTIASWEAVVLLVGFAVFAFLLCVGYRLIRTRVFYDAHMLDSFFDAGGDMTAGLIACSVVAKWLWTSSLTWSTAATKELGLVGHFWYSVGSAIQIFLFAVVIVEIRIKSPGAKTFLQVIHARFGAKPHILLMVFALLTNVIIVGMVTAQGTVILSSLTQGIGKEVLCIILTIVIGLFTVVGGVGGGIYVAYFICVLMLSTVLFFLSDVYFNPLSREDNPFGSIDAVYNITMCGKAHVENDKFSLMTFLSEQGVLNGAAIALCSFSAMFVDQSFWLTGIAGKPTSSVWGFLSGGLVYLAVPLGGGLTLGMAYWALTLQEGHHIVSDEDSLQGFIPVLTSQIILGKTGDWLIFAFSMVAVVAAASGEVLSVSSIVIYDIYQTYVSPFNVKEKQESDNDENDVNARSRRNIHNEEYLKYDRKCRILRHVTVISSTVVIIPVTLVILKIGIDLQWLLYLLAMLVGSCVFPISLAIMWHRVTGSGVIAGVVAGLIGALIGWLVYASTFDDGLTEFQQNTSEPMPVIIGSAIALIGGGLVCAIVSLMCGGCSRELMEEEVWEITRKIDNPVVSWSVRYAPNIGAHHMVKGKPHFFTVRRTFRAAEMSAYIAGVLLSVMVLLVWPACMLLLNVFTYEEFRSWVIAILIVCILATAFIALVPLIWEIFVTCRQIYYNKQWASLGKPERLNEENSDKSTKITDVKSLSMHSPAPHMKPQKYSKDNQGFHTIMENESASNQGKDNSSVGSDEKDRWQTFINIDE